MTDNKSILIVKTSLGLGGIERSLIEFLRHLDYGKYNVDLLLLYGPFDLCAELPEQVKLLNAESKRIQLRLSPLYILYYLLFSFSNLLFLKRWAQSFKHKKSDTYHQAGYKHFCHNQQYDVALAYQQGFACEYVARFTKAKRKIMMYHHGDVEEVEYHTPWFKAADILLTVSKDVAEKLKEVYPFAKNKVSVIPNLLDADVIREKAEEYDPELSKGQFTICTCGRISPEKGIDLAIGAAKILMGQKISFHWYFVGDGYDQIYVDSIRQQISLNGLDDQITITGFLTNPYPYLKNCDIIVIPSRFEANPMIIQEAKILAKPIVATKTSGAMDALIPNETGVLCGFSAEEIATSITQLFQSPDISNGIVRKLKQLDFSSFQKAFYSQWDELLKE